MKLARLGSTLSFIALLMAVANLHTYMVQLLYCIWALIFVAFTVMVITWLTENSTKQSYLSPVPVVVAFFVLAFTYSKNNEYRDNVMGLYNNYIISCDKIDALKKHSDVIDKYLAENYGSDYKQQDVNSRRYDYLEYTAQLKKTSLFEAWFDNNIDDMLDIKIVRLDKRTETAEITSDSEYETVNLLDSDLDIYKFASQAFNIGTTGDIKVQDLVDKQIKEIDIVYDNMDTLYNNIISQYTITRVVYANDEVDGNKVDVVKTITSDEEIINENEQGDSGHAENNSEESEHTESESQPAH